MPKFYVNWVEYHSYSIFAKNKEDATEKVKQLHKERKILFEDSWDKIEFREVEEE